MKQFKTFNIVRHLSFLLAVLLFVFVSLMPIGQTSFAQKDPQLQVPTTIEGTKESLLNIGDQVIAAIPRAIASIWSNQVIPAWKGLGKWLKTEVWEERILPAFEQELKKEKEELRQDIEQAGKEAGKGIWERFQALFRED
jgi:gas vesicle protein